MRSIKAFTRSFCEKNLKRLQPGEVDFEEWLKNVNQPQFRKDEMRTAWEAAPHDDPNIVLNSTEVKSFIKDEFYLEEKPARAINARCDWFKCFCGPLFDAIGKQVFALEEFIKTVPVADRPADIMDSLYDELGKLINADASSYEAHFIAEVMDAIEFELYRYMTEAVPEYKERMERIMEVLAGQQKLKFKFFTIALMATRMSGEMNTSLGNGFTTLVINLFFAWLRRTQTKLRCEGDDNLSNWIERHKAPTTSDFQALGWIMKVELPDHVWLASFCGNVFDPDDKIVVTDPRVALLTFGWTNKRYVHASDGLLLQLLRSKALSMAHQYNGCPLLSRFARKVVTLTEGVVIRKSVFDSMEAYKRDQARQYAQTPLPDEIVPSLGTRSLVEKLYSIPIAHQLAFESGVEQLELWSSFDYPFEMGTEVETRFETYTSPIDQEWQAPCEDHDRLKRFLGEFGAATDLFLEDYYPP